MSCYRTQKMEEGERSLEMACEAFDVPADEVKWVGGKSDVDNYKERWWWKFNRFHRAICYRNWAQVDEDSSARSNFFKKNKLQSSFMQISFSIWRKTMMIDGEEPIKDSNGSLPRVVCCNQEEDFFSVSTRSLYRCSPEIKRDSGRQNTTIECHYS